MNIEILKQIWDEFNLIFAAYTLILRFIIILLITVISFDFLSFVLQLFLFFVVFIKSS